MITDLYRIYLTVNHTKSKSLSPQKAVRWNKASPYPVHQQAFPVDLEFSGMALRSLHTDEVDVELVEVCANIC